MRPLNSPSPRFSKPRSRSERGCWEHCIAGLIGCDPLDVPDLSEFYPENGGEAGDWHQVVAGWLQERGLALVLVVGPPPSTPHIVTGPSPRDDGASRHAVIFEGDDLVYDPHSSGDGLAEGLIGRYLILDAGTLREAAARARAGGPGV